MANPHYERLSAMDAMFLEIEDASVHMNIGTVALFEANPILREGGGLDFERILGFIEAQLHKSPRLRQKLSTIPTFEHPVWVDDAHFNLIYHVRHTALPEPGDLRQLKRLAGRILSQQLDRAKPLWEIWFVEGVEGGRCGVITKLHHCMADGVSSGNIMSMLMGTRPDYQPKPARAWTPRTQPADARMFVDELARRATGPLSFLARTSRNGTGDTARSSEDVLAFMQNAVRGAWRAAAVGLRPATQTPLNVEIGPHRRFDWMRVGLDDAKRAGREAGGTVNDVVLAVVAGAVRHFLLRHGGQATGISFRVAVPVSVRSDTDEGRPGNQVSSLVMELPLDEADPWKRLLRVIETSQDVKHSGEAQIIDLFRMIADWLPRGVMTRLSHAGEQAVNMVVTNVPGVQVPVYMLGARMLESYPVVPLMANEALNIALYSYDGGLFWGFNADWEVIPDLHEFVQLICAEFEALVSKPHQPA